MTLSKTMKAILLTGHGAFDKLVWSEDVPTPSPKAGEVLIRVGASAVNNTDVNTRTGWYSKSVRGDTGSAAREGYGGVSNADGAWSGALSFPRIQGADCCGEIVAVGKGVDSNRVGQRVLVQPIHLPPEAAPDAFITLGSERDGAFAEYTTVASQYAFKIDSPLTDIELASFPCAFSTAEGMIERVALGEDRVLITGASGGVGSAAVQLAKRRGAHVTVMTSTAKMAALQDLGADTILERNALLPNGAFDVILDLVGGVHWPDLLDALVPRGRYVTSGAIAGPIVELDLRTLYLKDLTLIGSTRQAPCVFPDLVAYIERGEIRPLVAETYPLHQLREAQEAFLKKYHIGKIGIDISC